MLRHFSFKKKSFNPSVEKKMRNQLLPRLHNNTDEEKKLRSEQVLIKIGSANSMVTNQEDTI